MLAKFLVSILVFNVVGAAFLLLEVLRSGNYVTVIIPRRAAWLLVIGQFLAAMNAAWFLWQ